MNPESNARRSALRQLIGMTALGAWGALRHGAALGAAPAGAHPRDAIRGRVVARSDADYELWRQSLVWHRSKPARYPEYIVRAKSEQDVIEAVAWAAREKLRVSVRSGGHNASGACLRDGALVIDVSSLEEIHIDAERRIASIQPGVRSEQLIATARAHGLSFPVPHCPSVGLSGFTLGGGIGWNYPQCGGVATFSILAAEIVLADGRKVLASPTENPDLYWAVRGSGPGFFGVVTRLFLQLYPLANTIMASSYIFPLAELGTVTSTLEAIRAQHDVSRAELIALLMHHPEVPADADPERSKICFFTAFAFESDEAAARAVLQPFADSALATRCVMKMEYQPFAYEGLYDRFFGQDDSAGKMARYAVDNVLTNEGGKALHALADHLRNAPGKDCHVLASFNMQLRPRADACFSWEADCFVGCYAIWDEAKDDPVFFDWLARSVPLMDPFAVGHYVNEVEGRGQAGHPERFRGCFTAANWERLQQLRAQWDPAGVFHHYLGHS